MSPNPISLVTGKDTQDFSTEATRKDQVRMQLEISHLQGKEGLRRTLLTP